MLRRPPISTLFPTRRSSDLKVTSAELGDYVERVVRRYVEQRTGGERFAARRSGADRKSTRLNSSHVKKSYAVFCLKKKKKYVIKIDSLIDLTIKDIMHVVAK